MEFLAFETSVFLADFCQEIPKFPNSYAMIIYLTGVLDAEMNISGCIYYEGIWNDYDDLVAENHFLKISLITIAVALLISVSANIFFGCKICKKNPEKSNQFQMGPTEV